MILQNLLKIDFFRWIKNDFLHQKDYNTLNKVIRNKEILEKLCFLFRFVKNWLLALKI